jgi:type III restriction enzyme
LHVGVDETTPQQGLILSIHKRTSELIKKVHTGLQTIQSTLSKDISEVNQEIAKWELGQNEHRDLYKKATAQASEHKQKLDQIEKLRTQEADIQKKISELDNQVKESDSVSKEFEENWSSWTSLHRKRGDMLEEACRDLTEKSSGEIVAEVTRGGDIEKALGILEDILRGCNIREQNWTNLNETLLKANPAEAWKKLMDEIRPLAEMSEDEIPSNGTVPEILSWSLTLAMRKNIVERLKPRQWLDIALTSLEDLPVFYYKPRDSEKRIKFKNASAGQQATALLKVLLKETSGPLIIDQPEEDLDNEIIRDIAEEIWIAKEGRQIIFASHNANIVVNGDAELVIWCAYRETGDSTKGCIAGRGAIDIPEIRKAITNVMEGGQKAFELRRQKYGF